MEFLQNFIIGIFIGCGAIIPGISSGVFCVIFGIYEKLIDSVLNFFKFSKKNFCFLFPIVLGIIIGVLIFSRFLNYLLVRFPIQTNSIFIGLILGCIPSLFKELNKKFNFKYKYFLYSLISFILGILLVFFEKIYVNNLDYQSYSFFYLMLSGFLMSVGIVIPGISSTIILMLLNVYQIYLSSISSLNFSVLVPMGIGIISGSYILMKTTNFLFKKFYIQTFYTIFGFSLGSILVLFPKVHFDLDFLISFICIILGYLIISIFNTLKHKNS